MVDVASSSDKSMPNHVRPPRAMRRMAASTGLIGLDDIVSEMHVQAQLMPLGIRPVGRGRVCRSRSRTTLWTDLWTCGCLWGGSVVLTHAVCSSAWAQAGDRSGGTRAGVLLRDRGRWRHLLPRVLCGCLRPAEAPHLRTRPPNASPHPMGSVRGLRSTVSSARRRALLAAAGSQFFSPEGSFSDTPRSGGTTERSYDEGTAPIDTDCAAAWVYWGLR